MIRPGSFAWLVRHDLRIAWRDARAGFGRLGPRALAGLLVLVVGGVHAAVWDVAGEVGALAGRSETRAAAEATALPFAAFLLLLMVAQTLNGATKLLYARGDLDLVLSSPMAPRRILAARALAVALGAFASAAIFVLPLADAGAMRGHPGLLGLYPALADGALLAAGLSLAATLGLFRLLGPRRTRLVAQVLATLVGAGFVIALQVGRLLPAHAPPAWLDREGWVRATLTIPVRAAFGDARALALWTGIALVAFGVAALLLAPGFVRAVDRAGGGVGTAPVKTRNRRAAGAFPSGPLPALRRKEWRLIGRDPWLVGQVLLQILYMTPLIALLWSGSGDPALALAPMIAVVTFQVSSSLAWLGLSGEDAPDLLASAPVPKATLWRGKIEAVGALALGLVVLPLLTLAWISVGAALATAALAALGLATAVALQSWHGVPGRRSAFGIRHRESKLMALVETVLSVLFGLAAALAVVPSAWALAPVAAVGAAAFALRPRTRDRRA